MKNDEILSSLKDAQDSLVVEFACHGALNSSEELGSDVAFSKGKGDFIYIENEIGEATPFYARDFDWALTNFT